MKILDFLNQLIDDLPFNQNESLSFQENVEVTQKKFLEKFNLVDEADLKLFLPLIPLRGIQLTKKMLIHKFKLIHLNLNSAIEKYYDGKPASAYQKIKKLLIHSKYSTHLSDAYQGFLLIKDFRAYNELHWYRLRELTAEEGINPEPSLLFHPPFEKRGKIKNFRFSISGFPCLYLGDSLNVCWKEINKKGNNNFASRLTFTGNQSFLRPLNITTPEPFTEAIYTNDQLNYEAFCFLITFPVIQLCLYKVKDVNVDNYFKPEYIISQLLMQFVSEEGFFNSVIYSSTKEADEKANHNLVLPIRIIAKSGFCTELKKNIKITPPISVRTFDEASLKDIENRLLCKEAVILI